MKHKLPLMKLNENITITNEEYKLKAEKLMSK